MGATRNNQPLGARFIIYAQVDHEHQLYPSSVHNQLPMLGLFHSNTYYMLQSDILIVT